MADQWGPEWAQAVATFICFERDAQFPTKELRLPGSVHRPVAIKTWYFEKRAMSGAQWEAHGTGDSDAFGKRWWLWWADIQPEGRQIKGDAVPDVDGSTLDWTRLCKPGPTGVLLALVTLIWWKKMLGGVESDSWTKAVVDVEAALRYSRQEATPNDAPKKKRK